MMAARWLSSSQDNDESKPQALSPPLEVGRMNSCDGCLNTPVFDM